MWALEYIEGIKAVEILIMRHEITSSLKTTTPNNAAEYLASIQIYEEPFPQGGNV